MTGPRVVRDVAVDPNAEAERERARIDEVLEELDRARAKFPPFNSPHEGWAVIKEELDELWYEVKSNQGRSREAMDEARQIAAMALRYLLDLG